MMAWRQDSKFGVRPNGSPMCAHMYLFPKISTGHGMVIAGIVLISAKMGTLSTLTLAELLVSGRIGSPGWCVIHWHQSV